MKNNKETREKLAKQLSSLISEINDVVNDKNYAPASFIKFDIPVREPYKVLKVKEWIKFQKDIQNISYSDRGVGEVAEVPGEGFFVKSRTSFLSPSKDLKKALGIDAEGLITRILSEEINKAVKEEKEKKKENGTFKSRPQKD